MKKIVLDTVKHTIMQMGENSSKIFGAENIKSKTTAKVYEQSANFFADTIRQKINPDKQYDLADFGCFKGELLDNILRLLPEYHFHTYGIDLEPNLIGNKSAQEKVAADLVCTPLRDKSMDIVLMRYVLQWNNAQKQEKILQEIARVTRGFAIIQHLGADNKNSDAWRKKIDELLGGQKIAKLHRVGHLFLSNEEIEELMNKHAIRFERIQNRKIDRLFNVFRERYNLIDKESNLAKQILGNKDYIIQTSWLIYPDKNLKK